MRIGVDIMGGDFAPKKTIHGAILAQKEFTQDVKIVLFGDKKIIISELKKHNESSSNFEIIDCSQVIEMDEHAIKSFKSKPESSITKGFEYLANNKIDSFASAGNTGAMFVGGYYSVKAISGVIRPCICSILPKINGGVTVLLDVGANADCKPDVLYQFGILGSLYAKYVYGIKESKGNMLTQTTYDLMLGTKDYKFIGNIESRDLFDSNTDVIVCDGFTGNIVLKQAEAFYDLVNKRKIKDSYFERFNYENYGGTPILGLNKPVIIGHGISNEIAIKNMLLLSKDVIEAELDTKIKKNID